MFTNTEETQSFVASGDLSLMINRAVTLLGTNFKISGADAANVGDGILLNAPKDGEHAAVVREGVTMAKVGIAVTAGGFLVNAASGWLIPLANTIAGGRQKVLGQALTSAASGMLAAVDVKLFIAPNSI